MGMSLHAIYIRKLRELDCNLIMFYISLFGLLVSCAILGIEWIITGELREFSKAKFGYLISGALLDTICCFSLTIAFRNDKSSFVAMLSLIVLVYAFINDIFIFGEKFVALEFAGASVTFGIIFIISLIKYLLDSKIGP